MGQSKFLMFNGLSKYLSTLCRREHVPFSGTFELTPRCNLNCKMCYIRMDEKQMKNVGRELTVEEWLKIAREAIDSGMVMLLLTGGEPLLYKDFKKLYLELRKMGVFIAINSNGTLLDGEWIEFFKKYPPAKFNITIYGGSNETYYKLCNNPKGFDMFKKGIENLQKNNLPITLNCTITKQNIDDLESMICFAKEHNLDIHPTTYCFPPMRKEGIEDPLNERYNPLEAAVAKVKLRWFLSGKEDFIHKAEKISENIEDLSEIDNECIVLEGDKIQCAAGRANFWITWDGRMLPCGMIPDYSVSIRDVGFKESWKKIVEYVEKITLAPECSNCKYNKYCAPCAAKLKAETGYYNRKSEYLCEYTKEYIRLMKKSKEYLKNDNM